MKIYSICVGRYKNVSESKSDDKKVRALGITSYLFKVDEDYTLKVAATPSEDKAKAMCNNLNRLGLPAFIQ